MWTRRAGQVRRSTASHHEPAKGQFTIPGNKSWAAGRVIDDPAITQINNPLTHNLVLRRNKLPTSKIGYFRPQAEVNSGAGRALGCAAGHWTIHRADASTTSAHWTRQADGAVNVICQLSGNTVHRTLGVSNLGATQFGGA